MIWWWHQNLWLFWKIFKYTYEGFTLKDSNSICELDKKKKKEKVGMLFLFLAHF